MCTRLEGFLNSYPLSLLKTIKTKSIIKVSAISDLIEYFFVFNSCLRDYKEQKTYHLGASCPRRINGTQSSCKNV